MEITKGLFKSQNIGEGETRIRFIMLFGLICRLRYSNPTWHVLLCTNAWATLCFVHLVSASTLYTHLSLSIHNVKWPAFCTTWSVMQLGNLIICYKYAAYLGTKGNSFFIHMPWAQCVGAKDLWDSLKLQVSPDRTKTSSWSGNIFKNIFGLGWVGEFNFGLVRVGVFFTRIWDISFLGFQG